MIINGLTFTKQETRQIPGSQPREQWMTQTSNGTKITLYSQENAKKVDNIEIEFKEDEYHHDEVLRVMEIDPGSCFPYIIFVSEEMKDNVQKQIIDDEENFSISPSVDQLVEEAKFSPHWFLVNPTSEDYSFALTQATGVSKKLGAAFSNICDRKVRETIREILNNSKKLQGLLKGGACFEVVKPTPKNNPGVKRGDLEDVRVLLVGNESAKLLFHGEGKSIAKQINQEERVGMVIGKAQRTHGVPYDLFWHLQKEKRDFSWMKTTKSKGFCANAIVEFDPDGVQILLKGPLQDRVQLFQNMKVWLPDKSKPEDSKNPQRGPSLEQYILDTIKGNIPSDLLDDIEDLVYETKANEE